MIYITAPRLSDRSKRVLIRAEDAGEIDCSYGVCLRTIFWINLRSVTSDFLTRHPLPPDAEEKRIAKDTETLAAYDIDFRPEVIDFIRFP